MTTQTKTRLWEDQPDSPGPLIYYKVQSCEDEHGMAAIRQMMDQLENGPDENNVFLFSTSGVHGSYASIEDVENAWKLWRRTGKDEDGVPQEKFERRLTFMILHPRIVCVRYGNCIPQSREDFALLKRAREESWKVLNEIGKHDEA